MSGVWLSLCASGLAEFPEKSILVSGAQSAGLQRETVLASLLEYKEMFFLVLRSATLLISYCKHSAQVGVAPYY